MRLDSETDVGPIRPISCGRTTVLCSRDGENRIVIVRSDGVDVSVIPGETLSFGRALANRLVVGDGDRALSRQAGRFQFQESCWQVINTGRQPFYLVAPDGDVEVAPSGQAYWQLLRAPFSWIRLPGTGCDYSLVVIVPDSELPHGQAAALRSTGEVTIGGAPITLTSNEQRSVEAIYRGFLSLPPLYRREPRSFRAVAVALGVTEAKVKADHRRVVEKVKAAGGPPDGQTNREGLICWLLTRGVIEFSPRDG